MEGLVFNCFGTLNSQTIFGFHCTKTYIGRFIKGTALVLLCAVALTYGENNVIRRNAVKCHCDPAQAIQICENNFEKTDVVVAHEYCNQFYLCISGKPFGYDCPPSLLFDPVKEKCEQPELVDCAGRLLIVHDEERYRGSEIWVTTSFPDTSNDFLQSKDTLNIFDSTYNKYNCSGGICNHKPKEATLICSHPESRGFLIAHEKCNKFYKCDYNKPMEFTCHKGTSYNPQKGKCEWSSEVKCDDRLMPDTYEDDNNNHTNVKNVDGDNTVNNVDDGNSKVKFDRSGKSNPDSKLASSICALPHSSGILIAHEKCNKFYQCDNNKPVEVTCYNGTFYNPNNEKCDLPSKVDCGDRLISDIVDNESIKNGYNSIGGKQNKINDNYGTCNCDPEKAPSICASPGSNGTMIAHKSCNKFYKCDLNRPIEFTCPHGTLYNPYKEKCDWSNEVKCSDRLNTDIYNDNNALNYYNNNGDTNNGNKNNDVKGNGETCNCDPEKAPSICASPGSSGTLIAHKNCGKFYKCDQNIPVEFTCHKGTLYNPYKEKCDWSSVVKCGDRLISNVKSEGSKYNDGNYNRYNDNGSTVNAGNDNGGSNEETNNNGGKKVGRKGNRNQIQAHTICARPGSNGTLIAHKSCNKFYKCNHKTTVELTCPKGTVFNPNEQKCDLINNVECGNRLIPETDDDINNDNVSSNNGDQDYGGNDNSGKNNDVKYNDDNNENNNNNGDRNEDFNENGGKNNTGKSNKKKSDKRNRNKQANPVCASPDSYGTLIAHKICNKFYKCIGNKPVEFTCPKGTVFNPYRDKCDLQSIVECGDRLISESDENISNENVGNNDGGKDNDGNENAGRNNYDNYKDENNENYNNNDDSTKNTNNNGGNDKVKDSIDDSSENSNNNSFKYNLKKNSGDKNEDSNNESDINDDGKNKGGKYNHNLKQAYSSCANPDSNGTLIVHKECNKFYKCNDNIPVEFTCRKGTAYNPVNEECDWSNKVDCGDRWISEGDDNRSKENFGNDNGSGDDGDNDNFNNNNNETNVPEKASSICASSGSSGTLIAHKICNKYYICDRNKPVEATCQFGMFYSPFKEKCDLPSKVECGNRLILDVDDKESNKNNSNADGGNENEGNDNSDACNCDPEKAPSICANPGSNGTKIAHKECNKFYKCDLNRPIEMSCPYGTVYNPYKEICDWSKNTNCGNRINVDTDKTGLTSKAGNISDGNNNGIQNNDGQDNDEQDNAETCNCNPEKAPSICASHGSSGTLIAHEICNKFYKCHHNKPVEFSCHKGTVYNPYKEICDWPSQVECGNRLISDTDNNTSSENVVNNIGLTVNNESSINGSNNGIRDYGSTEKAPFICAGAGSNGTLVAHRMCNKFYKCDQNIPVEFTCGKGTVYDPYKAKCELPSKVECGDRLLTEIGERNVENIGNNNGSNELLMPPSHDESNDLSFSSSLLPLLNIIDYGGDNRDGSESGENVKDDSCNCDPKQAPFICAKPGSTGTMITHEMCNKYYKCDHNKPVEFTCANGTVYNPYKEICDRPSKVECGDRLLPVFNDKKKNNNCSNKVGNVCVGSNSDDDVNGGNNNDRNDSDENDNCNCNPELAFSICANPGSNDIMIAHEMCYKFYKCDHSSPVEFTCPNGTLYNPYKEICDWPTKVECGDRLPLVSDDSKINNNDDKNVVSNGNVNIDNNENDSGENNIDDTQNYNPEQAPRICAKNGSNGILIAHEKCNKFYKCDHNKPVEFICPNATLYNSKKKRCDEPSNVDCGNVNRIDGNNNEGNNSKDFDNDDNVNSSYNDDGECNCNPEDAPAICANPDSSDILIAHKMCDQFYKCIQNKPVEFSCSSGLLYNPYKEICDWPNKVECGDRMLSDYEKNEISNNDNDTDGDKDNDDNINSDDYHSANDKHVSGNDDKCNCDPEKAPIICAKPDSGGTLIAHKKCNKFYVCDQGKPLEFICRGIELYDPYKEKCDLPRKVDCGDRLVPSIDDNEGYDSNKYNNNGCDDNGGTCNWGPEKALTICANPSSSGSLIAHKMCNKFYKCHQGKIFEFYCPKGKIYNPHKKICDLSSITTCGDRLIPDAEVNGNNSNGNEGNNDENNNDEKANMSNNIDGTCNCNPEDAPLICANPDSNGILVAHEKCNKFYRCNLEKPVESTCPKNTLYNPYKEMCDWPRNVECGNRENPDSLDNDLPLLSILLGNDNNQVNNIKKINDNPNEAESICAVGDSSNGILIAHKNCNQFYMCGNGTPIAFKCPQDTLYNPVIEKCDWGDGVDCSGRIISGPKTGNNNRSNGYDARTEDLSLEIMPNVIDSDHNQSLPICSQSDGREVFIVHESCNKFYRCANGTALEMQCGGDLLFNPLTDQCDWPINVDCGRRIKIETDVNCACNPKNAPALCARENTDGKLIAHENCNQYYVCIKGLPMPRYCKKKLLYNIETEECDFPQNVDCSTRSVVTKKSAQKKKKLRKRV